MAYYNLTCLLVLAGHLSKNAIVQPLLVRHLIMASLVMLLPCHSQTIGLLFKKLESRNSHWTYDVQLPCSTIAQRDS